MHTRVIARRVSEWTRDLDRAGFVAGLLALSLGFGSALGAPAETLQATPTGGVEGDDRGADRFGRAGGEIQYFGGVDESSGLAVPGGTWTWDHGGSDPLEGWESEVAAEQEAGAFRHIDAAIWFGAGNSVAPPILSGSGSAWVGAFADEAEPLCWEGGLGYGNDACLGLRSPIFTVEDALVELSFLMFADTEPGYDYVRIYLDSPDGERVFVEEWSGAVGLAGDHPASPPTGAPQTVELPVSAVGPSGEFQLEFLFESDGSWSDEDGLFPTDYGPFAVDEVAVHGIEGGPATFGFDLGLASWTPITCPAPPAESGLGDVSIYFIEDPEVCDLSGNVVEFHDDSFGHPAGQRETLVSNPADLTSTPTNLDWVFAEFDIYTELPLAGGVFYRPGWSYYPYLCPNGEFQWSPRVGVGNFFFHDGPDCRTGFADGTGDGVPVESEQVRFLLEIYSSCDAFGIPPSECSGVTNFTPLFDNVRIGVTESPGTMTRAEAIQVLEREVGMSPTETAWSPYVDYGFGPGYEGLLPVGSTVGPAIEGAGGQEVSAELSYVFLLEETPDMDWGHEVRYAVVRADQPLALAEAIVLPQLWWMEIETPTETAEFFQVRESEQPAGPDNPDGLVIGDVESGTGTDPDPPASTGQTIEGDPCVILFAGVDEGGFPVNLDRFKQQFEDRGVPEDRIQCEKGGSLANLAAMVAALCDSTACDEIYLYIGAHGRPDSLFFTDPFGVHHVVTEAELAEALAPLRDKNAPINIFIQSCYSGSLIDGIQGQLPGARVITSADDENQSFGGGPYYDKPEGDPERVRLGTWSVFAHFFSDCWDAAEADQNDPPNGVDWAEAFAWTAAQDTTIYYGSDERTPMQANPQHAEPILQGSVWVASWWCAPGDTLEILVTGTVDPTGLPVEILIDNARDGMKANTATEGIDNADVEILPPNPVEVVPDASGRVQQWVRVVCPDPAGEHDISVYKAVLKVNGSTVDVDYGAVNTLGESGEDRLGAAVQIDVPPGVTPDPPASFLEGGASTQVSFIVWNRDDEPISFDAQLDAYNHYDTARGFLTPVNGFDVISGSGTPTVTGTTPVVPAGGMLAVVVDIVPDGFDPLSGLTIDLALWNGAAANHGSVVVLPGMAVADAPDVAWEGRLAFSAYPNPVDASSTIAYQVAQEAEVSLEVFDVHGRRVAVLFEGTDPPGRHRVRWDGRDRTGHPVASGAYFYRLRVGEREETRAVRIVR